MKLSVSSTTVFVSETSRLLGGVLYWVGSGSVQGWIRFCTGLDQVLSRVGSCSVQGWIRFYIGLDQVPAGLDQVPAGLDQVLYRVGSGSV